MHIERLSEASNHQKSSKGLNLNIKIGIQILSNALNISKNPTCASFSGSQPQFEKTSWFIDRSWLIQEPNDESPTCGILFTKIKNKSSTPQDISPNLRACFQY